MFINDNGLMAIERNFFDHFPNLKKLYSDGNGCVNKNFERFAKIEDILGDFEDCFDNWDRLEGITTEEPKTTSEEATTTDEPAITTNEPTTPGNAINLQISIVLLIFAVLVGIF